MATRRLIVVALAVAAGVAGLIIAAVFARGGGSTQATTSLTTGPLRQIVQPPIRVPGGLGAAVFFDHAARMFGDPVGAHVELLADRRAVDPESVRVRLNFAPYRPMAPPVRERFDAGNFVWVKYHYRLLCLRRTCRPTPAQARTFNFPDARISFRRSRGAARSFTRPWPPLVVSSRMKRDDLQRGGFRAREFPLPELSYRVKPQTLSTALLLGAAFAALGGVLLIWFALAPVVRSRICRARMLSELERELALLVDSLNRDEPQRRTALDRLSGTLRRRGDEELAGEARELAWSADAPNDGDVRTLAGQLERRMNGSK